MKKIFVKPEIKLTGMDAQQIMAGSNGLTGKLGSTSTSIGYGGGTSSKQNFEVH